MARFLVSHRLTKAAGRGARSSQATFSSFARGVSSFAQIISHREAEENRRGLIVVRADARDVEAKRRGLPEDVLIEPEFARAPARYWPMRIGSAIPEDAAEPAAGIGANLELFVAAKGTPVAAEVSVLIVNLESGKQLPVLTHTDGSGRAAVTYNPNFWYPAVATITPRSAFWSWYLSNPQSGTHLDLPALARNGPLGWWHQLLGITRYSEDMGKGVRVGIVDSGVGPHPYLGHCRGVGAFLDGKHDTAPNATADVGEHGTHVAGIVGARSRSGSGDFAGIAPGADVVCARVYPAPESAGAETSAGNGDVASAIDFLAMQESADLINLSLGGPRASEIEKDAIQAAIDRGVLVICAAGNTFGAQVIYPAAYPGSVAVSAVGLLGTVPNGSADSLAVPQQPDGFKASGIFSATFNNVGPQIACAAPGVGIISTVPAGSKESGAPYASMSGTSMACPAVCGALATLLSADPQYRKMPRDRSRAIYAWSRLVGSLHTLGLGSNVEGYGLASALSQ
jgi:subtilisin family serine protease